MCTLYKLGLAVVLIGFYQVGIAAESPCQANAVHCAYVTGLSGEVTDGRYIKFLAQSPMGSGGRVVCAGNTGVIEIESIEAQQHKLVGNNSVQFWICETGEGTGCQELPMDNFTIVEKDGVYAAEPASFEINLAGVKDKFKDYKCLTTEPLRSLVPK